MGTIAKYFRYAAVAAISGYEPYDGIKENT